MSGERIEVRTEDGLLDCQLVRPPAAGRRRPVLFYMDGVGVRPALGAMAERLAAAGHLVLLPNLFYRSGPYAPFDARQVFQDQAERARLGQLFLKVTPAGVMRDTAALLQQVLDREAPGEPIGCVGYCMGGALALTAAGTYPERVAAAASIHGARLATDAPDSPHRLAARMRARVYVGVAEIDNNFSPAQAERLRGALEAGAVRFEIETYPGASHGFAVDDMPVYDRAASERHWERLLALFGETLPAA
jgi:carboxymethylenebutenolidase